MTAVAKKILGLGIIGALIIAVIGHQDLLHTAFLACMGGMLLFILFFGEFIDTRIDLPREKIRKLISDSE